MAVVQILLSDVNIEVTSQDIKCLFWNETFQYRAVTHKYCHTQISQDLVTCS
jgi:hypothetical protein